MGHMSLIYIKTFKVDCQYYFIPISPDLPCAGGSKMTWQSDLKWKFISVRKKLNHGKGNAYAL
jgi:hypothetical protein